MKRTFLISALLSAVAFGQVVRAEPINTEQSNPSPARDKRGSNVAQWISNTTEPLLVLTPVALGLRGSRRSRNAARRIVNAQIPTEVLTEILKAQTRQPRPRNSEELTGLPSGHSAAAWAMATILADQYPDYNWCAYMWAGAVTWARVGCRAHTWAQSLAGALLGFGVAHMELNQPDGLFLHVHEPAAQTFVDWSRLGPEQWQEMSSSHDFAASVRLFNRSF